MKKKKKKKRRGYFFDVLCIMIKGVGAGGKEKTNPPSLFTLSLSPNKQIHLSHSLIPSFPHSPVPPVPNPHSSGKKKSVAVHQSNTPSITPTPPFPYLTPESP